MHVTAPVFAPSFGRTSVSAGSGFAEKRAVPLPVHAAKAAPFVPTIMLQTPSSQKLNVSADAFQPRHFTQDAKENFIAEPFVVQPDGRLVMDSPVTL